MTKYTIDFSSLEGEELLDLGDIFIDAIEKYTEELYSDKVEKDWERFFLEYKKRHPEQKHISGYEDPAWRHAQICVLNEMVEKLQEENYQPLQNMFWNGRWDDFPEDAQAAFNKAVKTEEVQEQNFPDYSCCDRYDFSMLRH